MASSRLRPLIDRRRLVARAKTTAGVALGIGRRQPQIPEAILLHAMGKELDEGLRPDLAHPGSGCQASSRGCRR